MNEKYDNYEMHPVKEVEGGYEQCEENNPGIKYWSVYGRNKEGLLEWLADCGTKETADFLCNKLKEAISKDIIAIKWHIDDVIERAEELEIKITEDEARRILEDVDHRHDCNYGITWDTFDYYLYEIEEQKKGA